MPVERSIREKAGVVPARVAGASPEVLLVSARSFPGSWIFPTGTVEAGETLAETAIRECREETGYLVTIGPDLGVIMLDKEHSIHRLSFFLGHVEGGARDWEQDRRRRWVSPAEAVSLVPEPFRPIAEAARRLLLPE